MRALKSTDNSDSGRLDSASLDHEPVAGSSSDQMLPLVPAIQPKMKIGQPGDQYEQQADHVADQVMRMPDNPMRMQPVDDEDELQMQSLDEEDELQMQPLDDEEDPTLENREEGNERIQMQAETEGLCPTCREQASRGQSLNCPECEKRLQMRNAEQINEDGQTEAPSELARQVHATSGQGAPMSPALNREMSGKIGADFSDVNIHTGQASTQMNEQLGAKAFTYGRDIHFNRGQYNPASQEGKHLLAHELTHVIQQTSDTVRRVPDIQRHEILSQPAKKNWAAEKRMRFQFRVDKALPAAEKGEKNTESMQWCMEQIFAGVDPNIIRAYQAGELGWTWENDMEAYKPGETIPVSVPFPTYISAMSFLQPEKSDEIEKLKQIQQLQEQLTHADYEYFEKWMLKTGKARVEFGGTGSPFDLKSLDEYEEHLKNFLENKEEILKNAGLLHRYYLTEDKLRVVNFEVLKDKLFGKQPGEITEAEKEEVKTLFKEKALAKVFYLLEEARDIAVDESAKYKQNPDKLDELVSILTGQYATKYNRADALRAEAIMKFYNDFPPDQYTVAGGTRTDNFRKIVKAARVSKEKVAETIAGMSSENVEWQLINVIVHNRYMKHNAPERASSYAEAFQKSKEFIETNYPKLVAARLEDYKTGKELKEKHSEEHRILYDISTDFRVLSRKKPDHIKQKITENLEEKKTNSVKTRNRLLRDPDLIWEFEPLLRNMLQEEGLSKEDPIGKIIHDKIESVKDYKFWRSLALGALGIVLGIAGFFTGGATWAGAALITASITVSAIDLVLELEDYYFQESASKAIFSDVLTSEPSVLGVVFALVGLVIDLADVLKIIKPLGKALKTSDEVAEYAGEIFEQIKSAGKLKEGVTKDDFIKQIVESWEKRQRSVGKLSDEVKDIIDGEAFQRLSPGVKEGMMKILDENPTAFSAIIKAVGDQPDVLTRLAIVSFADSKVVYAFTDITKLVTDSGALKGIFEYYGTIGTKGAGSLPEVIGVIKRGGVKNNPELMEQVLTNRSLQQVMLNHAANPDAMINGWKLYREHLANLPADQAKPSFLDFLEQKGIDVKLDEALKGAPKAVDITTEQVQVTAKLDPGDMAIVRRKIEVLVNEKGIVSGRQMQAIIRQAETSLSALGDSEIDNLRAFLWQLDVVTTRATRHEMDPRHLDILLQGFENANDFASSYTLFKAIINYSSGGQGVKMADEILEKATLAELKSIKTLEGNAFDVLDLYQVATKADVIAGGNNLTELIALAKAGSRDGEGLHRLSRIVNFMEEGLHSVDEIKLAIKEADEFDVKFAAALADPEQGLEQTAKLIWGKSAKVSEEEIAVSQRFRRPLRKGDEGSGSAAYKKVIKDNPNLEKIINEIVQDTEVDMIKWGVLRKVVSDATIDQSIKNKIIGDLWEKVNELALKNQGYEVYTQVPISYKTADGSVIEIRADAIAVKGDEVKLIDFKSGAAELNPNQDLVYNKIARGEELEKIIIKNEALDAAVKSDGADISFKEIRETYAGD